MKQCVNVFQRLVAQRNKMLVKDLIQRVTYLYSKGTDSDDSRLSYRWVYNKILSSRNLLMFQKSNKKQKISDWNYQSLDCIELVPAPAAECPCLPSAGCNFLKSKYKLPRILSNKMQNMTKEVSSLNGTIYSESSFTEMQRISGNKYTSKTPRYYIRNEYLYTNWNTGPRIVVMSAIFADPVEVDDFITFCKEPEAACEDCSTELSCTSALEAEFPIDDDLIDQMVNMAYNELIVGTANIAEDATNNTRDNTLNTTK